MTTPAAQNESKPVTWQGMAIEAAAADEAALRAAISEIVGSARMKAVEESSGLVAAHEIACRKAFLQNRIGPEVDVVRLAMLHLDKNFRYAFAEPAPDDPRPR